MDLCQQRDVSAFSYAVLFLITSLLVLVVKKPLANAGNIRKVHSVAGSGRSPGEGMATNCSILS